MGTLELPARRALSKAGGAASAYSVATGPSGSQLLPPIRLTDGAVEALKWIGLVLMTVDHVDKYLLHESVRPLYDLGRLAFPLFALVLAFNLARPEACEKGIFKRVLERLVVVGALSEIPFIMLGGLLWGWYPLNILVTLAVSTIIIWLVKLGKAWRIGLAVMAFLLGGAMVEFWWAGVAMCVAAWFYCRKPSILSLGSWIAATASLYLINRNWWALAAFPLIFYAPHARFRVRRYRWSFYAYYPIHLGVIVGLRAWLR